MILTLIFTIKELLHFSCRSNDLSIDLASSLASMVSRVTVDRSVHLSIELAEVVFVEHMCGQLIDFISLVFAALGNIIVVA